MVPENMDNIHRSTCNWLISACIVPEDARAEIKRELLIYCSYVMLHATHWARENRISINGASLFLGGNF